MSELSQFLDELSLQGQLDSEGDITLNALKARSKLETYQLEAPHSYVLPLVSGALLSGATVADFSGDFGDLTLDFDGEPLTKSDLEQILAGGTGRCAELGLGLMAAQAVNPERILVAATRGDRVQILEIKDGRPQLHDLAAGTVPAPRGTRIEVQGGESGELTLWDFLRARCGHCPIVALRGRRLMVLRDVRTCGLLRYSAVGTANPSVSAAAWVVVKQEREDFSGQIWLTDEEVNRFTFLLGGISYTREVEAGVYPGLEGIISHPSLRLDLSRSGVVADQTYRELLAVLDEQVEEVLLPRVLREYSAMLPKVRRLAQRHLRVWQRRCDKSTAQRISRRLGGSRGVAPKPNPKQKGRSLRPLR